MNELAPADDDYKNTESHYPSDVLPTLLPLLRLSFPYSHIRLPFPPMKDGVISLP